jgi:hypothetical protein
MPSLTVAVLCVLNEWLIPFRCTVFQMSIVFFRLYLSSLGISSPTLSLLYTNEIFQLANVRRIELKVLVGAISASRLQQVEGQ